MPNRNREHRGTRHAGNQYWQRLSASTARTEPSNAIPRVQHEVPIGGTMALVVHRLNQALQAK